MFKNKIFDENYIENFLLFYFYEFFRGIINRYCSIFKEIDQFEYTKKKVQ